MAEYEIPGPVEDNWKDAISSVEEIIEDARNGRMFILVDHEDRENEGDLVIPAQWATPDAVNFMAMYGRGLICLAMPAKRIEQRAKRFVEIEVAHHRHPRHEQSRRPDLTGMANECLGNGAARAAAWHQQGQAGQPELGVGIARDQSCNQRIGKPAMRRDRIDLRPLPLNHP